MLASPSKGRYSAEQKRRLLANLDLEVEHRVRAIEDELADELENFMRKHEGLISRIPRIMRDITLKEFAKYGGNVQECVKGLKREMLGSEETTIDKTTRKRKWIASQDVAEKAETGANGNAIAGPSSRDAEGSRAVKTARTMIATPSKKTGLNSGISTPARTRFPIPKTPGTTRPLQRIPSASLASPGPSKTIPTKSTLLPRPGSRPASPSKLPSPSKSYHSNAPSRQMRPPSSATFNPTLPPQPRWPRMDESMLSINGSPLANPLQLGLNGYLRTVAEESDVVPDSEESEAEQSRNSHSRMLRKKNSIIIRSSTSSHTTNGLHSRTNSQTSVLGHSHTSYSTHSRSNSHTSINTSQSRGNHPPNASAVADSTPKAPLLSLSALVSVPTKDGHILEFDPLRTSPQEIDALEGISDAAKQQAKEDMARLIQAAVERWKIS